jgi:hypothetical protein
VAVVFNEFEVVAEPPQAAAGPGVAPAGGKGAEHPPPMTPRDVEILLRREAERAARLRAD